jgi:8-oxo-dGTP diphosphatase
MKKINVVGAIIIEDQFVLCAQRAEGKALALKWEFPGGKIGIGETPEAAIIREIREELNCEIIVKNEFLTNKYTYDFADVVLTTFICELKSGSPQNLEHNRIEWLPINQILELEWAPADIPAVIKLEQERGLRRQ